MNNGSIRVPENFKHQIRKPKEKDPDFRIACIRDYIKEHKGEVIHSKALSKAAYGHENNSGLIGTIIKKLIKQGRITRTKVKDGTKGLKYTYVWHEVRVVPPHANGPIRQIRPPQENEQAPRMTSSAQENLRWLVIHSKEFAWSNNSDSLREFVNSYISSNLTQENDESINPVPQLR